MKKFTLIFALLLTLSVSILADDGTTHTGGKSCLPEQTCFVDDGTTHTGGKSNLSNQTTDSSGDTVLLNILDFLNSIFG